MVVLVGREGALGRFGLEWSAALPWLGLIWDLVLAVAVLCRMKQRTYSIVWVGSELTTDLTLEVPVIPRREPVSFRRPAPLDAPRTRLRLKL